MQFEGAGAGKESGLAVGLPQLYSACGIARSGCHCATNTGPYCLVGLRPIAAGNDTIVRMVGTNRSTWALFALISPSVLLLDNDESVCCYQ